MTGGGHGGMGAAAPVPPSSRKQVQSLKEIVNHPEAEVYAALRECSMDHRLLSQAEISNADVSAATANFQSLSLHNEEELAAKQITEDNPAVIIPDHLQVTNTECAYLSFGSFESGAFSGSLPQKTTDDLPVGGESAPTDQIDARNQDYYDTSAVTSSANENLEAMMGANIENVDASSVSQADVLRQDVIDPSDLQYDLPSISNHTYSNTNTSQPSTMEDPQGNNQSHTLSHLSNLMQANLLSTSLLGSNQSTLHDLEYPLPPYLAQKYSIDQTANPRPAVTMQEALKTGAFPNVQSTQNLPSTTILTGPSPPQQLAAPAHPYSQHTVPLPPFTNMIGYPYLPQNYATYRPSIFQQAYASNGPFHQSAAAVPGSAMKYSLQEYKNTLYAAGLQQQPSLVISGYGGGFGSSSNLKGNFSLNQNTGSASSTLGFDDALSRQFKDNSQYVALQQGGNSAMWLHGSGSRTAAALPPSHFYAYQGQSQQGGFRQAQQPQPFQFGGHGYPPYYGSQGGLTQEEHPQNLGDGSLNSFHTAPSQPSHPSWQIKETPEPRSPLENNPTSRGVRCGADRGGWNSSVHSRSADNVASRSSASRTGMPLTNSNQKQPVASSSVNKQMVADGPAVPLYLQYHLPSLSNHRYSNKNTLQPITMEDPHANNQVHTLSHLSDLVQANPSCTSLLGSNHSTHNDLDDPEVDNDLDDPEVDDKGLFANVSKDDLMKMFRRAEIKMNVTKTKEVLQHIANKEIDIGILLTAELKVLLKANKIKMKKTWTKEDMRSKLNEHKKTILAAKSKKESRKMESSEHFKKVNEALESQKSEKQIYLKLFEDEKKRFSECKQIGLHNEDEKEKIAFEDGLNLEKNGKDFRGDNNVEKAIEKERTLASILDQLKTVEDENNILKEEIKKTEQQQLVQARQQTAQRNARIKFSSAARP